ncbi:MAG: zinc ribbon domain-containing protein [Promethearchaeota archaeon]
MSFNQNSETPSNSQSMTLLGRSMKKYAISQWISMGAAIVAIIIAFVGLLGLVSINGDSNISISSILTPIIIAGIIIFGALIFVFVRYIQMLINLKHAGESSQDVNLQKCFKYIIITIFLQVGLVIVMLIVFFSYFNNLMSVSSENEMYAILDQIEAMTIYFTLGSFIIYILNVFAYDSLDKFGQNLKNQSNNNFLTLQIASGTHLMKISVIGTGLLSILQFGASFLSTLAILSSLLSMVTLGLAIMMLVGMQKAGKNMELFYTTEQEPGFQAQQSYQGFQGYGSTPSANTANAPNYSDTIIKPIDSGISNCPFCGNPLPDPTAQFCSMCGKKVR